MLASKIRKSIIINVPAHLFCEIRFRLCAGREAVATAPRAIAELLRVVINWRGASNGAIIFRFRP